MNTKIEKKTEKLLLPRKWVLSFILIISISSFSSSLYAQQQPMDTAAMRKRQEERLQQMKTDLKLTDVQADSVGAIQKEFSGKMRAIFTDQSMSMEDKRAKMQPLNEERNKRLEKAVGTDVYTKIQAWMSEHRPQRGGGGNN